MCAKCFTLLYGFLAGMKVAMLLLCLFKQTNAVLRINQTLKFAQLVDNVCEKFDIFEQDLVYFLFTIPGYNKFKVDCDDDVQNMLSLAKSFGLEHIDALIHVGSNASGIQCGVTVSPDDVGCETVDVPNVPGENPPFWSFGFTTVRTQMSRFLI